MKLIFAINCLLIVLCVNLIHTTTWASDSPSHEPPNIVLIIADDMAWNDCGAYGHPNIQTPHLDQLAAEGMRFDNAFLTCSSCSPSRSSIITGRYPHATGGAHQLHNNLPADQLTFVEQLRNAGYDTALAGKLHPRKTTATRFDRIYGTGPGNTGGCGQWLTCLRERPADKPFFLWLAAVDPHRGYSSNAIENPHTLDDVVVPPYLPDVPVVREDLALYYDEISRLDSYVGKVVAELKAENLFDNTLIVFISDNGRPFPRCKTTVYNSGVKTPMIASWPQQIPPGSVCDALVSTVDLAPTFCELAGAATSETFQGVSFSTLLSDPAQSVRDYTFSEHNWHDYDDHQRSCHSRRFNYIRTWYTDLPGTPPADAVKSVTFQKMHELHAAGKLSDEQLYSYRKPRPAQELYDVINDPHELHNLADDPRFASELKTHRAMLERWMNETGDVFPEARRPDEFDRFTGQRLKP